MRSAGVARVRQKEPDLLRRTHKAQRTAPPDDLLRTPQDAERTTPLVKVLCDVDNPLCGEHGAAHVYGPQKGATSKMVEILDANLFHLAARVKDQLGENIKDLPGCGTAGGLAAGEVAFLDARLVSGVDEVIGPKRFTPRPRRRRYGHNSRGRSNPVLTGQSSLRRIPSRPRSRRKRSQSSPAKSSSPRNSAAAPTSKSPFPS